MKTTGGVFTFSVPNLANPAMPIPSTTPWEGDGQYTLVLSTLGAQQYLYTGGKELSDTTINPLAVKYDFTGSSGTADWNDFKQLP